MLAFEVLPELYLQVRSASLKRGVDDHLARTKEHVARVEQAFTALGVEPSSNRSAPVAAMQSRHAELTEKLVDDRLADLFHARAAAQAEHYELAAYDALIELASALGREQVAELLARNREDEQEMLEELETIAGRLAADLAA